MNLKEIKDSAGLKSKIKDSDDLQQFVMNLLLRKEAKCPLTGKIWKCEYKNGSAILSDGETTVEFNSDIFDDIIDQVAEYFQVSLG